MSIYPEGQSNTELIKQLIKQLTLLVQHKQLLAQDKEERKILENLLKIIIALLDSRSTSKKDSSSNSRKRGVRASETGIKRMNLARAAQRGDDKLLTLERLAEEVYLSLSTVKRFFKGKNVDRVSAMAILNVLDLDPRYILETPD